MSKKLFGIIFSILLRFIVLYSNLKSEPKLKIYGGYIGKSYEDAQTKVKAMLKDIRRIAEAVT